MSAPRCAHCRKPMHQRSEPVYEAPTGEHLDGRTGEMCPGTNWRRADDRGTYECECGDVCLGRRIGNRPTGIYGYNGDAIFCTLRCGYAWAVAQVRARRRG